jgi:hypothetical protein
VDITINRRDPVIDYIEIVGKHPWAGHRGRLVAGAAPDMVQALRQPGRPDMYLLELENGQRTYAEKRNLIVCIGGRRLPYQGK